MYKDKKVVVVMPAYNAAKTVVQTHREVMEQGIVDLVILVDDAIAVEIGNQCLAGPRVGTRLPGEAVLPEQRPGRPEGIEVAIVRRGEKLKARLAVDVADRG